MRVERAKSAGGPASGTPAPRRPAGRGWSRLATACLAVAVLGLDGCASDPCGGGCGGGGGFGNSLRNATQGLQSSMSRMFSRCRKCKDAAPMGCDSCGGGGAVVEGVPVEGPVIPGPVVPAPGATIIPAPGKQEAPPTILDPAPPASSATGTRPMSSNVGPSSLRAPRNSVSAAGRNRGYEVARSADPLDNLPPVDLSAEVTRRAVPAVPAEADAVKPTSTETSASASHDAEAPVLKASIDASVAPGVARFSAVRPNVSGGAAPGKDGLDWLKEKGIKTIVDLRTPGEVPAGFADDAKARGFRYVPLPIDAAKPDAARVAAFRDEVTRPDGLPVYFFDADGTRAGLIWYVHRLNFDKVDPQIASREAAELGLTDKSAWVAATQYLDATRAAAPKSAPSASRPAGVKVTGLLAPLMNLSRPALNDPSANPSASAR